MQLLSEVSRVLFGFSRGALVLGAALCAVACVGEEPPEPEPPPPFDDRATKARMEADVDTRRDFWGLPMPSDLRIEEDGTTDLDAWPGDWDNELVTMWLRATNEKLKGRWGLSSGAFFQTSAPVDPSTLPADADASLQASASVFMVDVDPTSPDKGARIPLLVQPVPADRYTAENVVAARPVFGHVRRPNTVYALVVTEGVVDENGEAIGRSEAFHNAWVGLATADEALAANVALARDHLESEGFDTTKVVLATTFTTLDHRQELEALVEWAEQLPDPVLETPWVVAEEYASYQVLTAQFLVPQIQTGRRPYANIGEGRIDYDANGDPIIHEEQHIRLALTVPKAPMPSDGFPLTIYMHGSGGEWYQAINRGPLDEGLPRSEQPPPEPGSGPAEWLARRGVATLGFDFPLHGDRNDPPDTEGLLLYNLFGNVEATIDNFYVSAMELTLISRLMTTVTVDETLAETLDAGGASDGQIKFDPNRLTAMGQSMGTTLGVTWATVDPRVKGLVLSGAGGILVDIAVNATEPFAFRELLEGIIAYDEDKNLTLHSPILHAFQSLWDLADPVAHARYVSAEPIEGMEAKDIFMTAGITDGYFSPTSQSAMALGLEVERAGESVEPLLPENLERAGLGVATYPVVENLGNHLGVVIQYEAANTNGHYVVFNQEGARHQYTCFLATVGSEEGAVIPAPQGLEGACR